MSAVLVLGIGNTLRTDDGAGIRAAEQIATRYPHVDVETVHQLTPDLAERFHGYRRILIVDASVRASHVMIHRLDTEPGSPTIHSHDSSPQDLLALCRSLYGEAPEEIFLVEIPVVSFDYGETLSPQASRGVTQVVDLVGSYL